MSDRAPPPLPDSAPPQVLLGYLNFSEGRPDPRFHKQLSDAYAHFASAGSKTPWEDLYQALEAHLHLLREQGSAAFRDAAQVAAVLPLAFREVLLSYRAHHRDLLGHQGAADLWQPFFLARVCEAVLAQRGPRDDTERVVIGSLRQLNDYLGHRPIAVLESRRRGEPYDHERVRPIPLYVRGAGVAWGKYAPLVERALGILETTDADLAGEAGFDFALLDELALDPRGYDFGHPADKRPNYCFGEWDPHHVDNQARYRRYVARQVVLDALWSRVEAGADNEREELLFDAAAVLAGTVLMATGVSGAGPQAHDSTTTLSTLVPRIARYREAFYQRLLQAARGPRAERLRAESEQLRQPFGGARQHLNFQLGRARALQLQKRRLALVLAELGYPAASRRQSAVIPVASVRLLTDMHLLVTTGERRLERGQLLGAAENLAQAEDLLKRGIACGALADPWNVLGFQGQYPRFQALEDSVRDTRIDDLVRIVRRLFDLYARLLSAGARNGGFPPGLLPARDMKRLAEWWDRFATTTVSDIPHMHGAEAAASAEFVAGALERWRQRGATDDLAFWRQRLDEFRTPKAFALVVTALLEHGHLRAALALLMTWLSQAEQVALVDEEHSFHELALRWLLQCGDASFRARAEGKTPQAGARGTVKQPQAEDFLALQAKFFDYLEANAEDYWQVPRLDVLGVGEAQAPARPPDTPAAEEQEEETELFSAAYEDMSYQDSTDDDVDAEVLDVMPQKDFDLAHEAERLEPRLRLLGTVARLWALAAAQLRGAGAAAELSAGWLARARRNFDELLGLVDVIHAHDIPRPLTGSFDAMVEYDRRNVTKERLLSVALATCLDHALAQGALRGLTAGEAADLPGPAWEQIALGMERALYSGNPQRVRELVPQFVQAFRGEPLLYTPLAQGGEPRAILRSTLAQAVLRALVQNLPRQGLLRETYQLLRLARAVETLQTAQGPLVTEFDRIYKLGLQACTEAYVDAAQREELAVESLVEQLEKFVEPFLVLWLEHAHSTRVSMLELIEDGTPWQDLLDFVKKYGRELFTPRFLAVGNLRAILQRGPASYLEALRANPEPGQPLRLVDDLESGALTVNRAAHFLFVIAHALLDGYDHYRDFAATAAQSDYGDRLYHLLEFLRLRSNYERTAWQLRPLGFMHEVLARRDGTLAARWREQVAEFTQEAADHYLDRLKDLEAEHGMRLVTVRDRLEERFVGPLAVDRLCALVEPALAQARQSPDEDGPCPLEDELRAFTDTVTGVGMDAPSWLVRLEQELQRARAAHAPLASLSEARLRVPRLQVALAELAAQLDNWQQLAREGP